MPKFKIKSRSIAWLSWSFVLLAALTVSVARADIGLGLIIGEPTGLSAKFGVSKMPLMPQPRGIWMMMKVCTFMAIIYGCATGV